MANPRNLWVRDAIQHTGDVGAPLGLSFDLLWKARTGEPLQGSNLAVLADGSPAPRELFDRVVAPQDISGALVKRVFISYHVCFAPETVALLPDQTGLAKRNRKGLYEGVKLGKAQNAGYTSYSTKLVASQSSSVNEDWMWWNRRYAFRSIGDDQDYGFFATGDPTPIQFQWVAVDLDVKAQRRLREWDDTLRFYIEPNDAVAPDSTGETINDFAMSYSVLLETPS